MDDTIKVNGEPRARAHDTVSDLLAAEGIGISTRGIAVALNGAVLPKDDWAGTSIRPGDAVEIVRAMQGG